MSLDLGALVGSVILESTQFDRTYTRVVRQMGDLAATAEKSAAGTATLDEALAGVGTSAKTAAVGLDRATVASKSNATAEQRAAAVAERHAQAVAQVAGTLAAVADESPRVQAATLRVSVAQERLNLVTESGAATTRQLAAAQAGLITAERSLVVAQEAGAKSAGMFSGALMGTLKMAGELGLVIGGIEIAKKALEFVFAGKDLTDALNGVQAASHATNTQMAGVRAEAIALGKDLTIPTATAVDAAKAIEDLVRAGMTLPRALAAARPALLLAAAAQVSTADAARFLGDTLDDFQLPATQAAHVANALAGAATSAGGGLSDMFDAIKYAGPFARAVGVSVDSLVATIAELAKGGIQGTMAGTGIRMMLQKLAQDTPATERALKTLGVTAFTAQGQFVGLPKVIDELHAAQKRLTQQDFVKAISDAFGARAATAVASLAHKGIDGYNQFLARVQSGDVQKYADLMNRGVGAGFRQLGKEATAAGISVYQDLEPRLTTAVMWLGTNIPKAVHEAQAALSPLEHFVAGALTTGWHLFAGAVGIAVTVLGPVVKLLEDLKTPLGAVAVLAVGAWLGFQGAKAAGLLVEQLIVSVRNLPAAMVAMVVSARESAAGYVTSMGAIGSSSKAAATATTAAMSDIELEAAAMSGTVVAEGEAAAVGWAGLLGPIGAVAVGIGLLVTLFHHSTGASKEATDAAKAYTDALKSGSATELTDSIVTQLSNNGVPTNIAKINGLLGKTVFSGKEFATAIQNGGASVDDLRAKLQGVVSDNENIAKAIGKKFDSDTSVKVAPGTNPALDAAQAKIATAKKLLADLNGQTTALTKAQITEIANFKAIGTVAAPIDQVAQSLKLTGTEVTTYAGVLGLGVTKSGDLVDATKANQAAILGVAHDFDTATASGSEYVGALQTFSQSTGTASDRAALIGATLKAANGDALGFAAAIAGTQTAINGLTDAFKQQSQTLATQSKDQSNAVAAVGAAQKRLDELRANSKTKASTLAAAENTLAKAQQKAGAAGALAYADTERAALKFSTAGGKVTASIDTTATGAGDLITQLQGLQTAALAAAGAEYQHQVAVEGGKKAADDAYNVYYSKTHGALIASAKQLGLNTAQATALADAYFGIPSNVKTLIESEGTDPVVTVLNKIGQLLANFTGQPWNVVVTADVSNVITGAAAAQHAIDNIKPPTPTGAASADRKAAGGLITGPGSGTSDTAGLFALSNHEFVSTAAAVARNRAALEAANRGATLNIVNTGIAAPTIAVPGSYDNRFAAGKLAQVAAGAKTVIVHQTINNPLPEKPSKSGPANMDRAANRIAGML